MDGHITTTKNFLFAKAYSHWLARAKVNLHKTFPALANSNFLYIIYTATSKKTKSPIIKYEIHVNVFTEF